MSREKGPAIVNICDRMLRHKCYVYIIHIYIYIGSELRGSKLCCY